MAERGRKRRYSKYPDEPMTITELEIFKSQEIDISQKVPGRRGETYEETIKKLHVDRNKIAQTKKKADYNELAKAALMEKGFDVGDYVQNLIDLSRADKTVVSRTEGVVDVPDNITRFNAVSEIGDIFGAKAPKKLDLKHSMAAMSDDELAQGVEDAARQIEDNGRTRQIVTGSQDAGVDITHQGIDEKSGLEQ